MNLSLKVKSSLGEGYQVEFSDESGSLRVFCHCPAGSQQQMCKHKLALLKGDASMLFDKQDEGQLKQVLASKAYEALWARLKEFESALLVCEQEMSKLKARERTIKSDFAYELTFAKQRIDH